LAAVTAKRAHRPGSGGAGSGEAASASRVGCVMSGGRTTSCDPFLRPLSIEHDRWPSHPAARWARMGHALLLIIRQQHGIIGRDPKSADSGTKSARIIPTARQRTRHTF